jgi:ferredoxin
VKDHVRSQWHGALLVCGKCSKKLDGGFGAKRRSSLARALRAEPGLGKGRKATIGVVETRCLGICPKGAVTLVDTREPDRWRLVTPGTDVSALADRLLNGERELP